MANMKDAGILIADDEGGMRDLLASILKGCGCSKISLAADGTRALDLLTRESRDIQIAFLDINMPGLSGIEVMMQMAIARPDCFCVIVTGNSDLRNVMAALELGARGFVVKPYNIKKIADILAKYERESAP
ncbi:response regulator [Janthinobacterium sp.]|uniref:response regulator n=1 Tax=Janthinobacterium sp. TaxID=1871054 RepID=UPI00293D8B12|nr:response regulator [Janthinobacterium sp.]